MAHGTGRPILKTWLVIIIKSLNREAYLLALGSFICYFLITDTRPLRLGLHTCICYISNIYSGTTLRKPLTLAY